ncbi:hypothetical protein ID866_6839 [Astraeus odoratus]|nr:hypothetical protein ID866_6839 [Astraeus odoratus]
MVVCPWQGCTKSLQYMNLPRHIRSAHLGVRFCCERCGKSVTRKEGIARHGATCGSESFMSL